MKTTNPIVRRQFGLWLIAALLLSCSPGLLQRACAGPVSSERAAAAVRGWLKADRAPLGESLGSAIDRVETFKDQKGEPLYYVVYLAPSGFVILPADDLAEPIVAFAKAGRFDPSSDNPLGALVSRDLPGRVSQARRMAGKLSADSTPGQAKGKWRKLEENDGNPISPMGVQLLSDIRVAPLTQTTWSQQTAGGLACYNYYTPPNLPGSADNYPAGCVATALAQLMRYYQYPTVSIGTAQFPIKVNGATQYRNLLGGDGSGGPYGWANMPLMPGSPTAAQCQAIGRLVADCGTRVAMEYWPANLGGSASNPFATTTALTNTFYYSRAVKGWNGNGEIGSGLTNMINPNLDARYPVLLGVQGSIGGHAVLADGYGYLSTNSTTLYHHLNLGWAGTDTAWYALPTVDTVLGTFTTVDCCIYNIYTNGTGEIISGRVMDQVPRPVAGATVTATRSGGASYTTTTDSQGIYALARIPANSTYTISVSKAGYTTVSGSFSTGTSADYTATSGNRWGANFTLPMLPTVVDHFSWSTIGAAQSQGVPFAATITARNATNGVATGFNGSVVLTGAGNGVAATNVIVGTLGGGAYTDTDYTSSWTDGYAFTPNTNLQVIAVRSYYGSKVSIWTAAGVLLVSQNVSGPTGTWTETQLASPVTLSRGTTYRIGVYYAAGIPRYYTRWTGQWPSTFAHGTVGQDYLCSFGDKVPSDSLGTGQGPFVDLRYIVPFANSIPISPASAGPFVSGVWSGSLTLAQSGASVVLKADDGAGHTGWSNPFDVNMPILLTSPQRLGPGQFRFTLNSAPGLRLEVQASTNLTNWSVLQTVLNSSGTTNITDSIGLPGRLYKARQAP